MKRYILPLFTVGMMVSLYVVRLWGSTHPKEITQADDGSFDEALVQLAEREKLNVFCDASDAPAVKARAVLGEGLPPATTLRAAVTEQQPFLYIESPSPVPFSFGFNTRWAKEGK